MELRREGGARANRINDGAAGKSKLSGHDNFHISILTTERT